MMDRYESAHMTPKIWTDKEGNARPSLDLLAHACSTGAEDSFRLTSSSAFLSAEGAQ